MDKSIITNIVGQLLMSFISQIAHYTQMIDVNTSTTKKLLAENSHIELQISALKLKHKQNEEEQKKLNEELFDLKCALEELNKVDQDVLKYKFRKNIEEELRIDVITTFQCSEHYDETNSHPFNFPSSTSTRTPHIIEDVLTLEGIIDEGVDFCGLDAFDHLTSSITTITFVSQHETQRKKNARRRANRKYDNMSAKLDIFDKLSESYYTTQHNHITYYHNVDEMKAIIRDTKNKNGLKTTNLLSLLNQYNKPCLVNGQSLLTMEGYLALCNEASL
jgi:hypothetical protein